MFNQMQRQAANDRNSNYVIGQYIVVLRGETDIQRQYCPIVTYTK